jgi:YhcH/YjgK/YiaL family protein
MKKYFISASGYRKEGLMLTDTFSHLSRYLGIDPNLDTAIRWLGAHDLAALPLGRTEIDGQNVFLNVMEAAPRARETADFEVHARYMDLQFDLDGREAYAVAAGPTVTIAPIDPEKDIGFVSGEATAEGLLGGGRFALFFAGEPHMPTLSAGDARIRKGVCKIRAGEK